MFIIQELRNLIGIAPASCWQPPGIAAFPVRESYMFLYAFQLWLMHQRYIEVNRVPDHLIHPALRSKGLAA